MPSWELRRARTHHGHRVLLINVQKSQNGRSQWNPSGKKRKKKTYHDAHSVIHNLPLLHRLVLGARGALRAPRALLPYI